jgi:hypothetical protein
MTYAISRRPYTLRGRYRNVVRSGAITGVAAHTATAGHIACWRWDDTTVTGLLGFVRYVGVKFMLTTAFGTDQEMGFGMRIADTGALTAGTHTLDANPVAVQSFFAETVGDEFPSWESGNGYATLWDSRESGDHLEFDNDEGFIISNEVAMGATGVGNFLLCVDWDEGVLNGGQ